MFNTQDGVDLTLLRCAFRASVSSIAVRNPARGTSGFGGLTRVEFVIPLPELIGLSVHPQTSEVESRSVLRLGAP